MISVVIPLYNKEEFIVECLDSVINSISISSCSIEILVVDDCSTDNSLELCKSYSHQISLIQLPRNSGPSAARNMGINKAKNDFILFLDADDLVHPYAFKYLVDTIKENPEDNVFLLGVDYLDGTFKRGLEKEFSIKRLSKFEYHRNLIEGVLLFSASSTCINKNIVNVVGYFNEHSRYTEDSEFWARISERFSVILIDTQLIGYRIVQGSLSQICRENLSDIPILLTTLLEQNKINKSNKTVRLAYSIMFLKYTILIRANNHSANKILFTKERVFNCINFYFLLSCFFAFSPSFFTKSLIKVFRYLKYRK
ncbi:glycosyltransferase family 2 protein [Marinomonas arenicola]|uniref:Glycosyltransferase family 2 protein n=1 Tax=Marinomonas arenicola TaxID=569601 RepID=A0ABU9G5P1_9GAMM